MDRNLNFEVISTKFLIFTARRLPVSLLCYMQILWKSIPWFYSLYALKCSAFLVYRLVLCGGCCLCGGMVSDISLTCLAVNQYVHFDNGFNI